MILYDFFEIGIVLHFILNLIATDLTVDNWCMQVTFRFVLLFVVVII